MINIVGTGPYAMGSPDIGVNPDHFSVRWEGWIVPARSETYTFTLRGDDLNALWIDDKPVVQFENPLVATGEIDPPAEKSGSAALEAGNRHKFKLEHGERRGVAEVRLFWSSPSTPRSIVPQEAFVTADGKPGGLSASFWNDPFCGAPKKGRPGAVKPPILTRVDPSIDFKWGPEGWQAQRVAQPDLRPGRCQLFAPVALGGSPKSDKRFTVRLHFAEFDGIQPGQRVFDVKLQDAMALKDFEIAREAGGCNLALVKEFKGVPAGNDIITVELIPRAKTIDDSSAPILSGVEIAAE
jgi:hypothetical protein